MSDSVRPHRRQPTRLPRCWDSPGKNTGVGCHFLLQCMKVKSRRWQPTPVFLPGESHGQRSLAGYSLCGHKELDTTERLSTCAHTHSVQFSCSVVSDSLRPHGLQHARPPCPSPIPQVSSNSCPLSGCRATISSSVVPFSSCLQSFPALGSFQMSQFFTTGGRSIGVSASASVLPMNIQE